MRYLSFTIIVFLYALNVQGQTSPHGKEFKIDCSQCHSSLNWKVNAADIQFDHSNTSFKLAGQHGVIHCRECHKSLTFKDQRRNCIDCHTDLHNQTLGKNCERCHTPITWIISDMTNIHQQTRFPLLGAHRTVSCMECHTSASVYQFETLGIDCFNCHKEDYLQTTTPNHVAGRYSTDCLECHSENSTSWNTGLINHDFFPLTGGHSVGCELCHVTKKYEKISAECNTCHNKQFAAALLPKHVEAGIPVKCETCHKISAWKPSSFNHTATGFELKGAHKSVVQCADCHKGSLTTAVQTCMSCHQPQFDTALNHKQQSYPADCTQCHTQNNWIENIFNHSTTSFPLTGAHKTALCAKCHITGLKGTPTACYSCHATKYNASVNPNHLTARFPTNCEICHTSTAWAPSTYSHDAQYFPIYSGKHQGKWNLCSDCHNIPTNYATFTCILCHEHSSKTSVDADHTGVKNYTYASTACYNCHPQGR